MPVDSNAEKAKSLDESSMSTACEDWLVRNGLPQFVPPRARWRAVDQATPALIFIFSFALATEPWLRALVPGEFPVIVLLASLGLLLLAPVRWTLNYPLNPPLAGARQSHRRGFVETQRRRPVVLLRLLAVALLSPILFYTGLPQLYEDVSVDMFLMMVLLTVAARLRRLPGLTQAGLGHRRILYWSSVWLSVTAAALFIPIVATSRAAGHAFVQPSTLAFPVALVILTLTLLSVSKNSPVRRPIKRRVARAASWAVVLLAAELIIVPYIVDPADFVLVSVLFLAAVLLNLLRALVRADGDSVDRRRSAVLRAVGVIALAAFLHLLVLRSESSNIELRIIVDAILALGGALMVVAGIDRTGSWAFGQWIGRLFDVIEGVVRGLPVLLVFLLFLGINEELWGIAADQPPTTFLGIAAVLVMLTIAYLAVDAKREIESVHAAFKTWSEVVGRLPDELRRSLDSSQLSADRPSVDLTLPRTINLMIVALIYRAFVLVPAGAAVFGLFLLLGHSVVKPKLFTEDDRLAQENLDAWLRSPFIDQPWTEVAFVLAVFSILYFAVHLTTQEQRQNFSFHFADHLHESLAVVLVYDIIKKEWPDRRRESRYPAWVRRLLV